MTGFFAPDKQHDNGEKGFALVVVIVVMLLITFLAAQLILNVRTELQIAHNAKMRAKGLALAQAGMNLALFRLLDKPIEYINEEYETFLEAYQYDSFLETGHTRYYLVNESGKIDLNKLNRPLLTLFLDYLGVEPDDQEIIIDSLLDWRDSDDLHRINGAEEDTYQELDDPYIPRNGKIMDPSEFFLVYGTENLRGRFKPHEVFTIHNSKGTINFNSLTPMMLHFLTEDDEEKILAYREAKELYGTLGAEHARFILGDVRYDQCAAWLTYSSGNNRFYSINASGEAGVSPESLEEQADTAGETARAASKATTATALHVLFELRGATVNYYSWETGRS